MPFPGKNGARRRKRGSGNDRVDGIMEEEGGPKQDLQQTITGIALYVPIVTRNSAPYSKSWL